MNKINKITISLCCGFGLLLGSISISATFDQLSIIRLMIIPAVLLIIFVPFMLYFEIWGSEETPTNHKRSQN